MKIVLQILIVLSLLGCSNTIIERKKLPSVILDVQQDKYSLILKHHFYKKFQKNDKNLVKFIVKTNLKFNTSKALSNKGSDKLNIIKATVNFTIFNSSNTKIIKSDSISSSINTGNVSSLYSVDENNNFAKERLSIYLASKLYRKILLNLKYNEN